MSNLVQFTYWRWEAALSPTFCKAVLEEIDWADSKAGEVTNNNIPADPSVRVSDVIFQNFMQPLGCIAHTYIAMANTNAGWNYALSDQESTQLTRYKSIDNGHYDWHMDSFPPQNGVQRKLSCVILLNDPSEFEGGILQFKGMEDRIVLDKLGTIVVFPSFIEHKVTPVTKGVRYTAVSWASGPSFK